MSGNTAVSTGGDAPTVSPVVKVIAVEMDEDFKRFLSKMGITETEYTGGALADKTKLVEAFEKIKTGKIFIS